MCFIHAYGNTDEFAIGVYALIVIYSQRIYAFVVSGYDNAVSFEIGDSEDGVAFVCPLSRTDVYSGATAGDLYLCWLTGCNYDVVIICFYGVIFFA